MQIGSGAQPRSAVCLDVISEELFGLGAVTTICPRLGSLQMIDTHEGRRVCGPIPVESYRSKRTMV
jgi:hypothetical protein